MNIDDITYKIRGAIFEVNKVLGYGFLEKVYENALAHQLRKDGMRIEQQKSIKVYYDNIVAGCQRSFKIEPFSVVGIEPLVFTLLSLSIPFTFIFPLRR